MFSVDPDSLIVIIIAGLALMIATFIIVLVSIAALTYEENPVQDRLYAMKQIYADETGRKVNEGPFDELIEAMINFAGPVSKNLYGGNQKLLADTKAVLADAGEPDTDSHVWRFLALQVAVGILAGALLSVPALILLQSLAKTLLVAGTAMLLGKNVPLWMLKMKASKRKTEIRFKLPDSIDLMVVCVEAGLALDATIKRVAEETTKMAPEVSSEFKRLNRELNAGIPRMEAFQNMANRCGVDEMRSLCAMIIQSDKLGTSISKTLRIYADDMRTKRRQKAEELASKASIKMTFVLVLLIFPPMFIVLLGGPIISAMNLG